jgi:Domain of unknown function (DUF3291)
MQYHLAQLNISRLVAPLDTPQLADFVAQLAPINALAEASAGFVWRLMDEAGNATNYNPFDDDMIIVNMSVWETLEDLKNFAYKSAHTLVMRDRAKWFEKAERPMVVLWWVPIGHEPSTDEAKAKLEHLRLYGETPAAFTFKRIFSPNQIPTSI